MPFGFGRRSRGVEHEQRVLGVQRLGRAVVRRRLDRLVVEEVAAVLHVHVGAGVAHHDHRLDRGHVAEERVHLRLDVGHLALAPGPVHRDQRLRVGELHALLHRVRREAAEHHVVGAPMRAQASMATATSGIIGRKIPTTSPGLHAAVLQHVGQALHVAQQLGVGHIALLALLAAPVEGDPVAPAGLHVAVEAVVRGVQLAAGEPLVERRLGVVQHLSQGSNQSSASACLAHQACGSRAASS